MRDRFNHAIKKTSLAAHVKGFHICRTTVGTMGAACNVNQKALAELLGHRDPATTANYYQKVEEHQLVEVADAISKKRGVVVKLRRTGS